MEKDELYELLQEGLKEINERKTRHFNEVVAEIMANREDVRNKCFNHVGLYAECDDFILRSIRNEDKEDYLKLYRTKDTFENLFDRPEYDLGEALWNDFNSDSIINTVIIRKSDGAFCGFCGLQGYKELEEPELSIELGKEFQGQGIGYKVLTMLMSRYREVTGQKVFISKVSPGNLPSQKLMKKLGGKPHGIVRFPGIPDRVLKIMEEEGEDPADDLTLALAEEFGTTPRKLKSNVLVFRIEKLD